MCDIKVLMFFKKLVYESDISVDYEYLLWIDKLFLIKVL